MIQEKMLELINADVQAWIKTIDDLEKLCRQYEDVEQEEPDCDTEDRLKEIDLKHNDIVEKQSELHCKIKAKLELYNDCFGTDLIAVIDGLQSKAYLDKLYS